MEKNNDNKNTRFTFQQQILCGTLKNFKIYIYILYKRGIVFIWFLAKHIVNTSCSLSKEPTFLSQIKSALILMLSRRRLLFVFHSIFDKTKSENGSLFFNLRKKNSYVGKFEAGISAQYRALVRMDASSLIYLLCKGNSIAPVSRRRL